MLSFVSRLRSVRSAQRRAAVAITLSFASVAFTACSDSLTSVVDDPDGLGAGIHRQYGAPVAVGSGHARTYITIDQKIGGAPIEIGVALDESALEGLPATVDEHGGESGIDLALPTQNPTSYRFVELDWNPLGHEPDGVYDKPHFDFHFYMISAAERDAIDPVTMGGTTYAAKANNLPIDAERYAFYVPVAPPGEPVVAVPHMGVHWADLRAPELQGAFGHPENARPFTTTFLHGSWDGRFIFDEPMVTRAYILGRKAATAAASRDSLMTVPAAQRYSTAGYQPDAYRVVYEAQTGEYHIALTRLTYRQ